MKKVFTATLLAAPPALAAQTPVDFSKLPISQPPLQFPAQPVEGGVPSEPAMGIRYGENCKPPLRVNTVESALDAYRALEHLAAQPYVDKDREGARFLCDLAQVPAHGVDVHRDRGRFLAREHGGDARRAVLQHRRCAGSIEKKVHHALWGKASPLQQRQGFAERLVIDEERQVDGRTVLMSMKSLPLRSPENRA